MSVLINRPTRLSNKVFKDRCNKVHNNKYNYSKVNYIRATDKVKIICPYHGEFEQIAYTHLRGNGCIKCRNKKRSKSKNKFIEDSIAKFGDKFDYSKVKYVNGTTKITLRCPIHGELEIIPRYHLKSKTGCPKCALDVTRYNLFEFSEWELAGNNSKYFESFKVYIIKCFNNEEIFYKIGKTFTKVNRRYENGSKIPYNYEIIQIYEGTALEISYLEKFFHKQFRDKKYYPKIYFEGQEECFSKELSLEEIGSIYNKTTEQISKMKKTK